MMIRTLLQISALLLLSALSLSAAERSDSDINIIELSSGKTITCGVEAESDSSLSTYLNLANELNCEGKKELSEHCSCIAKVDSPKLSSNEKDQLRSELGYLGSLTSSPALQVIKEVQAISGLYGEYGHMGINEKCIEEDEMNKFMSDTEESFKKSATKDGAVPGLFRKDFFDNVMGMSKTDSLSQKKKESDNLLIADLSKYLAESEKKIESGMSSDELRDRTIASAYHSEDGSSFVNSSSLLDRERSKGALDFLSDSKRDFSKYAGSPLLEVLSKSSEKTKGELSNYLSRVASHSGLVSKHKKGQLVDDSIIRKGIRSGMGVVPLWIFLPSECERIKEKVKSFISSNYHDGKFLDNMTTSNKNLSMYKGMNILGFLDHFDPNSKVTKEGIVALENRRKIFETHYAKNLSVLDPEVASRLMNEKKFNLSRLICSKFNTEVVKTAFLKDLNNSKDKSVDELFTALSEAQSKYKKTNADIDDLKTADLDLSEDEKAAIGDLKMLKTQEAAINKALADMKLAQLDAIEKGNPENIKIFNDSILITEESAAQAKVARIAGESRLKEIRENQANLRRRIALKEVEVDVIKRDFTESLKPTAKTVSGSNYLSPNLKDKYDVLKPLPSDLTTSLLESTEVKEYSTTVKAEKVKNAKDSKGDKLAERVSIKKIRPSPRPTKEIIVKDGKAEIVSEKKAIEDVAVKAASVAVEAVDSGKSKKLVDGKSGTLSPDQVAVEDTATKLVTDVAKDAQAVPGKVTETTAGALVIAHDTLKTSSTTRREDSIDNDSSITPEMAHAEKGVGKLLAEIGKVGGVDLGKTAQANARAAIAEVGNAFTPEVMKGVSVKDLPSDLDAKVSSAKNNIKQSQYNDINEEEILSALEKKGLIPAAGSSIAGAPYRSDISAPAAKENKVRKEALRDEISELKATRSQKTMERVGLIKDNSRLKENVDSGRSSLPLTPAQSLPKREIAQKVVSQNEEVPEQTKARAEKTVEAPQEAVVEKASIENLNETKQLAKKVKKQIEAIGKKKKAIKSSVTGRMTHDGKSEVAQPSTAVAQRSVSSVDTGTRAPSAVSSKKAIVTKEFDFSSSTPLGLSTKSYDVMPILDDIGDSYNRLPSFEAPEDFMGLSENEQGEWVEGKFKGIKAQEVVILLPDGKKILVKKKLK